jgi:NADH dehydrogenase FAD-containing subunit
MSVRSDPTPAKVIKDDANATRGVVIYGGGVAGAVLAKQLSRDTRVTLVDPLDYFEVPMAAPRALVDPTMAEQSIIPLSRALPCVDLVQARLVELRADGGVLEDAQGVRTLISGKVSVLATGSQFANALMRSSGGAADVRKALYQGIQARLGQTRKVLIVGGGPIGVEVAGEISESFADIQITLIDAGPRLLRGTSQAVADFALAVLERRGVTVLLNDTLTEAPQPAADVFAPPGRARTSAGRELDYDLLLWCIGGRPNTAYMRPHFEAALNDTGQIKVGPDLRVKGQTNLLAMGDITDLAENKMAFHIQGHVKVAEANVRALLAAAANPARLLHYQPKTLDPTMLVTLGSRGGVSQLPKPIGVVRAQWFTRALKARNMLVPRYRKVFGV